MALFNLTSIPLTWGDDSVLFSSSISSRIIIEAFSSRIIIQMIHTGSLLSENFVDELLSLIIIQIKLHKVTI